MFYKLCFAELNGKQNKCISASSQRLRVFKSLKLKKFHKMKKCKGWVGWIWGLGFGFCSVALFCFGFYNGFNYAVIIIAGMR